MIYRLKFSDKEEFATAKNQLHLLQNYEREFGGDWQDIEEVEEISDDEAKVIMLTNTDTSTFEEMPEFSLYDQAIGDQFAIIGSTDWD